MTDQEFYKAVEDIHCFLLAKSKTIELNLEIATACNHLYTIKERQIRRNAG